MGLKLSQRLGWSSGAVALAAVLLAAPAASASPKFTAKSEVHAIVLVHNTFGTTFQDFYSNLPDEQNTCEALRANPDSDWSDFDHNVAGGDESLVKDFKAFNGDLTKSWLPALERFRPSKRQRANRKLFDKAAGLMRQAHDEHAKEIFNLSGAVQHLRAHDCDPVSDDRSAAATPGRMAWSDEYLAIHFFAKVFKLKITDLNWPPANSPYDQAG